jgi:hypothetical protein
VSWRISSDAKERLRDSLMCEYRKKAGRHWPVNLARPAGKCPAIRTETADLLKLKQQADKNLPVIQAIKAWTGGGIGIFAIAFHC